MKPENKIFACILAYCALLWIMNWSLVLRYERDLGVTTSGLDLRGAAALIGLVAAVILARRVWRVSRAILQAGIRIPRSVRLWGSWSYLSLLLPLTFGTSYQSSGLAADGAPVQTLFEYGGGFAWASLLFSATAIMLFQLLIRLESFNPESASASNPGTPKSGAHA